MSPESHYRSMVEGVLRDYGSSWKSLVLTDIAFKFVAFIVLTPLVSILFRSLISISGSAVVSDMDILFFLLGPVGWVCAIIVGALWLGITALEQASLMAILCANSAGRQLGPLGALQYAGASAWPVIRVTTRMVALLLIAIAPFLLVAAAVYLTLLTKYDINYYLQEKPPVFRWAVGIGVIVVGALAVVLLRLATNWFFALPLVLFEKVNPREALKVSTARAQGHRRTLIFWVVGWVLAMAVLSALATAIVGLVGRLITPDSTDALRLLVAAAGITLFLWAMVNLAVNLVSTTTFAATAFGLYRTMGRDDITGRLQADFAAQPAGATRFRITPGRLLAAAIVGIVIAVVTGVAALRSVRPDDHVKIMAHRGSSKMAPENTVAAFSKAIDDGADWIELDVQETAEGEVIVMHDSDFMKLAGQDLKIWDATMEDVNDIDIGSWFAPEFKDERAPKLAEVLDICKGKIGVNIELKYYGHDEQLEQRVADIVESCGMSSDVMAMSLKIDGVKTMKSIRPDWKVGLLMSVSAGNLDKIQADFLAVNAAFANRRLVRTAHDNDQEIYVWTVDDAPTMSAMISRGVDGILTNKPALARSVLEQRAQMSAPERLLLELAGLLGTVPEIGDQ